MSFRRAGLPVRSGLFAATTGHLNVVRHLILAGAILMPAALPARAASPPDCSGKPERGVWVGAKPRNSLPCRSHRPAASGLIAATPNKI